MTLGGLPMRLTLKQILEKSQMGEKLTFSQDGTDWIVFYIAREKMFMMDMFVTILFVKFAFACCSFSVENKHS